MFLVIWRRRSDEMPGGGFRGIIWDIALGKGGVAHTHEHFPNLTLKCVNFMAGFARAIFHKSDIFRDAQQTLKIN